VIQVANDLLNALSGLALIGVLAWFICGLIAALVFYRRGRGILGGFVAGFLFGPVGIAIVLLFPPTSFELEHRMISSGHFQTCPMCMSVIRVGARVCRYCCRELPVRNP
jgi:hypothetical protein